MIGKPVFEVVEHYPGGYQPTLRLKTSNRSSLISLAEVFRRLARMADEVDLMAVIAARRTNVASIRLITVADPVAGSRLTLWLQRELHSFCNGVSRSHNSSISRLVDGILTYAKPSHQYLTDEGRDDILVELCFAETSPSKN